MRRRLLVASLALAALLALAPAAVAAPQIRDVDLRRFPSVSVIVSSDAIGELDPSNVRVTENGLPVVVSRFRPVGGGTRVVEAVLAIDVSNSMRGGALTTALAAARTFAERVPAWISVGVVAFADTPEVVVPLAADRDALTSGLASMSGTTRQGTALYDGVVAASQLFGDAGQHNVIVLTDGRNTAGLADLEAAVAAAHDAQATVFAIGLRGPETDEATLRTLAERTRGTYASIAPGDLDAAYTSLARQLTEQYIVTYRSKAPYGVPITIEIGLPDGAATVKVVTPAPAGAPVGTADPGGVRGILSSPAGLLVPVSLTFAAMVVLAVVVTSTRADRRRKRELAARITDALPPPPAAVVHGAASPLIPQHLAEIAERGAGAGLGAAIDRMIDRAGWSFRVGEIVIASLTITGLVALAGTLVLGNPVGAAIGPLAGVVPFLVLSHAGSSRIAKLQGQLADVCMILASSLRAGHSFLQSLDTVSKEIGEPAATEFNHALAEIRLGRPVEDSLDALVERIGSLDLEWAVTAINIQRKVGGNLAEVLETVAATIREREMLRRQVRALTSEGRLSASILTVLPFLIALYLMIVNPTYLGTLTSSPVGITLIGGAALLMVVGYVWMRKIVKIDA